MVVRLKRIALVMKLWDSSDTDKGLEWCRVRGDTSRGRR